MKALQITVIAILAIIIAVAVTYCCYDNGDDYDADGYLYALYTDKEGNMNVVDVYESHIEEGRPTALAQRYRTSDSAGGINEFWSFDRTTGKGPFNTFYAAINLMDDGPAYDNDDATEKRRSTSVGSIAYVLDPYDLGRTLAGHAFTSDLYNIMLMIPTAYWVADTVTADRTEGNLVEGTEYNVLYISSSPSYSPCGHDAIGGMVAFAHSASTVSGKIDFRTNVYPYLGLGVYESYATTADDPVGSGKLVSQSGKVPTAKLDVDGFKALADSLVPASGNGPRSDYQQWNYYQWTLYKIMCDTVMGSMNSQAMVGDGYTKGNDSSAVTGSTDTVGLYGIAEMTRSASGEVSSENGRTAAKLFIENGWGSLNIFLGDSFVMGSSPDTLFLYAGNYLGGEKLLESRNQPSASQSLANIFVSGDPHRVIAGTSVNSATWSTPILADANADAYADLRYPGDIVNALKSGVASITVGGRWNNIHYSGVSFACAGYDIATANDYRGARLAYLLSEEHVL